LECESFAKQKIGKNLECELFLNQKINKNLKYKKIIFLELIFVEK
jgi:hypothetical protein